MKPVDAEKNPGLAKLPTKVRNKMGYMKKGGLTQHPKKNGSKRMKKFEDGGYTGNDEIVQYRMGQIKDPGIDLFKLVQGKEQVSKPIPLDKKPQIETAKSEPKVEYKESIVETESDLNPYGAGKGTTTSKKQSFGEAFKSARAGGGKTFTYNGKSYTTDLAKPKTKEPAYNAAEAEESYASSMEKFNPDYRAVMKRLNSPEFKLLKKSGAIQGSPFEDFERESRIIKNQRSLMNKKKGGTVKKMASGGGVSSASKRADGCAVRGKTRA